MCIVDQLNTNFLVFIFLSLGFLICFCFQRRICVTMASRKSPTSVDVTIQLEHNTVKGRVIKLDIERLKNNPELVSNIEEQIRTFNSTELTLVHEKLMPKAIPAISIHDGCIYLWNISSGAILRSFYWLLYRNNLQSRSVIFYRYQDTPNWYQSKLADLCFGIVFPRRLLRQYEIKRDPQDILRELPENPTHHGFVCFLFEQ